MNKKCSFEGCKGLVEISCECKEKHYHCVNHFVFHVKKVGNHLIHSTFMELKPEHSKRTLKELTLRCSQLQTCERELKKFCNQYIDHVIKTCRKLTDSLKNELQYFTKIKKMILERGEVDRDVYNQLSSSISSQVQIPGDFNELKDSLDDYLEDNYKIVEGEKQDDDYFWIYENSLFKIDLETLKKSNSTIKSTITSSLNSCKLQDDTYFVNAVGTTDCFLVNLEESSLSPIESCPVITYYGVIASISDKVYMINGYSSPMNEVFDLKTREWSKISNCPLTQHVNTGSQILERICLTCYYQNSAYIYDPKVDSYTKILSLSKGYKIVGHGFILTSLWAYKIEDGDVLKWKNFPYRAKDTDCCYCMMNTYVCKKEKYLYFCNCSQKLYRFDTKTFEYKMISLV